MTRSWAPHYHGLEVCRSGKKKSATTTSQAPHRHGPGVYNDEKKRPWWWRGARLLIVATLGCAVVEKRWVWWAPRCCDPRGCNNGKKKLQRRGGWLLTVMALGCTTVENRKPRWHNEKKNTKRRKGAYLVASLFFMLCSMQMKLHPSSKLLPLVLLTRVKPCTLSPELWSH